MSQSEANNNRPRKGTVPFGWKLRGEPEDRRRSNMLVPSGSGRGNNHPTGLAVVAFKAPAHRLRSQGLPVIDYLLEE